MLKKLSRVDDFAKNILLVFCGTTLVNFVNLLYQLLIAHKLSAQEFAAFNALLSVYAVAAAPAGTLQTAISKYCAQFNASKNIISVRFLLSDMLKKIALLFAVTLVVLWFVSGSILAALKIQSVSSGYILALLLATAWIAPLFAGGVWGLELFVWFSSSAVITSIGKLGIAYLAILLGYRISGALGALLASNVILITILVFPLRRYLRLRPEPAEVHYKEFLVYLLPVAVSFLCFAALVNCDMVLVKYFFSSRESGVYSLAQMTGKIFLFFPAAIATVMFPKASGLKAKNMDTRSILKQSLVYVSALCIAAAVFYNLFPQFVLKVLTGKVQEESIFLSRLFAISMSFFTLANILIFYFLSISELKFIFFLVVSTLLQIGAKKLFHNYLVTIQVVLCINSIMLFSVLSWLAFERKRNTAAEGGVLASR